MQKSIMILVFLFTFYGLGFSKHHHPQNRIFNGQDAMENEFPYMAFVSAGFSCSGSLINEQFVLTAAHCLMDSSEGDLFKVTLGDRRSPFHSDESPIKFYESMKFWVHENFTMPSAENDVGLIKLPHPIEFSESVRPLRLSKNPSVDTADHQVDVILAGFGLSEGYGFKKFLQKAKLKLLPINDCMKFQSNYVEKITKDHICAIGLENEGNHVTSPCDVDSGAT